MRLIATSPSKNLKSRLFAPPPHSVPLQSGVTSVRPVSKVEQRPPPPVENKTEQELHNIESLNVDVRTGRVSQLEEQEVIGDEEELMDQEIIEEI